MNRHRLAILVVSASALGACGDLTGADYRGAPLASISGQLILSPGTEIAGPIRVALVWTPFPDFTSINGTQGKSVVAQDMPAIETFPVNYNVQIMELPPDKVFGDLGQIGGAGRAARGFLVAYEDLNGNGTLDLIPPGGKPIDRVLGASINPVNASDGSFMVQYSNGTLPAYQAGVPNGFALINPGALPFSTSVPIYLTNAVDLNWLVCEQVLISDAPVAGDVCERPAAMRVRGSVGTWQSNPLAPLSPFAQLTVTDANFPWDDKFIVDAQVVVNSLAVPYAENPANPGYASSAPGITAPGMTNVVQVHESGYPDVTLEVPPVGNFTLTSPSAAGALAVGTPIDMTWTDAPGATGYQVRVVPEASSPGADAAMPAVQSALGTFAELPALTKGGTVEVEVDAEGAPAQDVLGSLVESVCAETQSVAESDALDSRWSLGGQNAGLYDMIGQPIGLTRGGLVLSSSSATLAEFGMATTSVPAKAYIGQRVRLESTLSTTNAGFAGLWMRVEDENASPLAFDNMWNCGVTGTQTPASYAVVLDVPAGAANIAYGVLLDGAGTVTASGLGLEVVSTSVAATNTAWRLGGVSADAYLMSGDPTGHAADSLVLSSKDGAGAGQVGAAIAEISAGSYTDRRVRLSGTLRTENVQGRAGLWITAGQSGTVPLNFDSAETMLNGTTAPGLSSVDLIIPSDATVITYGVVLDGSGKVTASNLIIELVNYVTPVPF